MLPSELPDSWCRYFAFGSNMSAPRLKARIAEAASEGRARLDGWALKINKRGLDGSAKANIVRAPASTVWGVVYRMPKVDLAQLDRFEGGYERFEVEVLNDQGQKLRCACYASDRLLTQGQPADWYKQHMVDGATAHDLPEQYIVQIASLPHCYSK